MVSFLFHKLLINFEKYSLNSENEVASLEEVKKTKDAEIEKYKKYLSKAKKIIESFGGSAKTAPEDALEVCLLEREREWERESLHTPVGVHMLKLKKFGEVLVMTVGTYLKLW